MAAQKISQEEMLLKLSPPPFNQSKAVPKNAVIDEHAWQRSASPRGPGEGTPPPSPTSGGPQGMTATSGVLGQGSRSGPVNFVSQNQTGCGTAAHFVDGEGPSTIPGYSGHIAGKNAGNVIGGTYETANQHAVEHLHTTSQVNKYGALAGTKG